MRKTAEVAALAVALVDGGGFSAGNSLAAGVSKYVPREEPPGSRPAQRRVRQYLARLDKCRRRLEARRREEAAAQARFEGRP